MTENHAIEVDDMIKGFGNEKTIMKSEHETQVSEQITMHAQDRMELGQQKDAQREELRTEMQLTIDNLLAQIEAEKQNMGAAGKKREEELLAKIQALR